MFYTYILYSQEADKFYIGVTENPEERLKKHNNKNKGFTNRANDWKIVFLREFNTKPDALSFEGQIKNWKSRIKIQKLNYRSTKSFNFKSGGSNFSFRFISAKISKAVFPSSRLAYFFVVVPND